MTFPEKKARLVTYALIIMLCSWTRGRATFGHSDIKSLSPSVSEERTRSDGLYNLPVDQRYPEFNFSTERWEIVMSKDQQDRIQEVNILKLHNKRRSFFVRQKSTQRKIQVRYNPFEKDFERLKIIQDLSSGRKTLFKGSMLLIMKLLMYTFYALFSLLIVLGMHALFTSQRVSTWVMFIYAFGVWYSIYHTRKIILGDERNGFEIDLTSDRSVLAFRVGLLLTSLPLVSWSVDKLIKEEKKHKLWDTLFYSTVFCLSIVAIAATTVAIKEILVEIYYHSGELLLQREINANIDAKITKVTDNTSREFYEYSLEENYLPEE